MKSEIHPEYNKNVTVKCGCGATWITSSTKSEIRTEICSNCHPFWTGEQRIVDTEGRVERMKRRYNLSESEDKKS